MPTVSIARDGLFRGLGMEMTDEEFDELCFEYGLELDDVVVEKTAEGLEETVYKVDVPANRYDLLCLEGLVQALRVFKGIDERPPEIMLTEPTMTMNVQPDTAEIRPYVVCAVLRDVTLTPESYQSLIDLQEKLHQNICRKRTLVAIGTHDLDTLRAPFSYEALQPRDIQFAPLNQTAVMHADDIMTMYETDLHLKKFLHIIRDAPRYPVIYDANRLVCSMPPIINGNHSKIKLETKNILIECTATDRTKSLVVLNILISMFSRYCAVPFQVEPVRIHYLASDESGDVASAEVTPLVDPAELSVPLPYVRSLIGVDLPKDELVRYLSLMMLRAEETDNPDVLTVFSPVHRADVLHACDVAEDIAVAYGFNRIEEKVPSFFTTGAQQKLGQLSDLMRREALAQRGYTEVLTWVTVSNAENFSMLQREDDGKTAVKIANPKTLEFQECRVNLLSGVLKTLRENRKMSLPIQLFEVGDVVRLDKSSTVGARNVKHLCAIYCGTAAGFEIMKALLDHVMLMVGVLPGEGSDSKSFRLDDTGCTDDAFFPGRRANVIVGGSSIGTIGWVHPQVLVNFSLSSPCSALELEIESFL